MEEEGYVYYFNKVWNFLYSIVFELGEFFFIGDLRCF